jgi:uncharacterized NAD(P)/FAD-binding protein YdhS
MIIIVGGGFCGAFCASELAAAGPGGITIVEPRAMLGGGVAYSSTDPAHRINVPAARMTLFPERPADFDDWIRRQGVLQADPAALWADGHAYPQRAVFGRYVAALLPERAAAFGVSLHHTRDQAVAATRTAGGWRVQLAGGGQVAGEVMVLAVSHPAPQPPPLIAALGPGPDIIANPWAPGALDCVGTDEEVAIIGTGLTMADMVASLTRRGHRGRITSFSRRGQLARGHAFVDSAFVDSAFMDSVPDYFATIPPPRTALALSRQVRAFVAQAAAQGLPWQLVLDNVRTHAAALWGALDLPARRQLLRHLRSFWDAHRYRVAPQVEAAVQGRIADGALRVLAASLRGAARRGDSVELTLHPRMAPANRLVTLHAQRVIVTTGPAHAGVIAANPLLSDLAAAGWLHADALGLGIAVDARGRVLGADGVADETLYVAGPLARERYGELMGLPQVAAQPRAVAQEIAAGRAARRAAIIAAD